MMRWQSAAVALSLSVFYIGALAADTSEAPDTAHASTQPSQQACLLQVGANKSGITKPHRQQRDRISVEVYYETQCPFCENFLNTTLRLMWDDKELRESMDLKLYPFGNAAYYSKDMVSRGYHFWHPEASYPVMMCQHGESECLGNRIHACAVDLLQDSSKYVPFIICMASFPPGTGIELSSYECGEQHGISMKQIKQCANSEKGQKLMSYVSNATLSTNISYVPWVMVDGQHTQNDTLLMPLCDLLPSPKPKSCPEMIEEHDEKNGKHQKNHKKGEDEKHGGSGPCLLSTHVRSL